MPRPARQPAGPDLPLQYDSQIMHHRTWVLVLAVAAVLGLSACGSGGGGADGGGADRSDDLPGSGKPALRLGTKNFTEQFILGELYAQALRARGWDVALKADIGSSEVADKALTSGVIDLYPEYIGTTLSVIKGQKTVPKTAQATYSQAKAFYEDRGQTLLAATPFSNRDALGVTKAFAAEHDLSTPADLRRLGSFTLGAAPEFRTRFAGLVGLRSEYGLRKVDFKPMLIDEIYGALDSGEIQVADVFTTDAQLASGRYVVLSDPKAIFGFQNVAPVISRKVLDVQGKVLAETLNAVSAKLTNGVMQQLNAQVAIDGREPADVAKAFLRTNGLL